MIRSPGAMMIVVNIPEKAPAAKSWVNESLSVGFFCCKCLPRPKPKKLNANIGAIPVSGAPMPIKYHIEGVINI